MIEVSSETRLVDIPRASIREAEKAVEFTDDAMQASGEHVTMVQPVLFSAILANVRRMPDERAQRCALMGTFAAHRLLSNLTENTGFRFPVEQETGDVNVDGAATYGYFADVLRRKRANPVAPPDASDDLDIDYIASTTSVREFTQALPNFYDSAARLGARALGRPYGYFNRYLKTGRLITQAELNNIIKAHGGGYPHIMASTMAERYDFTEFLEYFGFVVRATSAAQEVASLRRQLDGQSDTQV